MSTVFAEPYTSLTPDAPVVLTVGHSTRSLEDFLRLLQVHKVTYLADVRTVPRSRHNPQFNRETLPQELEKNGIGYVHLPALGGLRKARADSPNMGWRNVSFRGYADYMLTPEFAVGLQELIALAGQERVAIMCAEAVPWRCHRSLIGDALLVRGLCVEDIMSEQRVAPHKLTPWAQVSGDALTYPPEVADESPPPTP
ncbi:MAG: DUF488 domain-containing protein [Chloroflexota bacterium]|nr:DUF488 domain-containing protein [Chloroflexota bacterium]